MFCTQLTDLPVISAINEPISLLQCLRTALIFLTEWLIMVY